MKMTTKAFSTMASALAVAASANAGVTVIEDYTFDDAASLAPFTVINGADGTDISVSGGQVLFSGDDALTIANPLDPDTTIDNILLEAVLTLAAPNGADGVGADLSFPLFLNDPGLGDGNNGLSIFLLNNTITATVNGVSVGPAAPEVVGAAVTVSVARQNGETFLYIDGTQVAGSLGGFLGSELDQLVIGNATAGFQENGFNGSIDRVRISTIGASDVLAGDASNDNFLTVVPEPSSLALLGLGGLLAVRRRRS